MADGGPELAAVEFRPRTFASQAQSKPAWRLLRPACRRVKNHAASKGSQPEGRQKADDDFQPRFEPNYILQLNNYRSEGVKYLIEILKLFSAIKATKIN
ncbi:MAG: hypothetical protein LBU12_01840 [Deltaproteobacteria bacterium]|nr:hypothetical protein [Deltaproteobacteria bacterium]